MPPKTQGQQIAELIDKFGGLDKIVASLTERIDNAVKTLDALYEANKEGSKDVTDLRLECKEKLTSLKHEVDELRRWTEKHSTSDLKEQLKVLTEKVTRLEATIEKIGTRAWSVVPNVAGAFVNVVLSAIVALIVTKLAK